jgi:UDP-glucose 4-epimerase
MAVLVTGGAGYIGLTYNFISFGEKARGHCVR